MLKDPLTASAELSQGRAYIYKRLIYKASQSLSLGRGGTQSVTERVIVHKVIF